MNWHNRKNTSDGLSAIFLQHYDPKSRFAEAYRTLRTNIHYSFMEKGFRSILISSSGQGEGKTSTVANLGFTMSQVGKNVLMIDADLRKPRLHHLAAMPDAAPSDRVTGGLTGLLAGSFGTEIRKGLLSDLKIRDILRLLSFQKKTGWLQLENGNEKIALCFLQGELVDLNWFTRPEENRLATVLVRNALITEEQAKSALLIQKDTDQKLAYILISMGLVSQEKLVGPLTIHMMEGLRIALQFQSGSYVFDEMSEVDFDRASFDPVDFRQLKKQLTIGDEDVPFLQAQINAAIVKTQTENLFLLPAGNLPPNPTELLSSASMSFLLGYLKKRFDILIVDTPPILPASDALMLAPQTDGVVMIVKPGTVNRNMIKKAIEQLRVTHANLLGIVLNRVDTRREAYYKYYHKYYSQYYGERG